MTKRSPTGSTRSFFELLRWRAEDHADHQAYTYYSDPSHEPITLTYAALDLRARTIGALLQATVAPGDRVLLVYPPGLDYVCAFFGCLYAQAIAVPVYPPRRRQQARLDAILRDADVRVALTESTLLPTLTDPDSPLAALRWLATDRDLPAAEAWQAPAISDTDIAFLQYTSGSTSAPKGVMVSHGNLVANSAMIYERFGHTPQSRGTIWLPAYHDMGLIGGILQPLFGGFPVTLLSPLSFLQRPLRWLETITQTRSTTSGGPNFAYELCVQRSTPAQRANLDLSSWRVAFCGAEPINPQTLERFTEAFAPCGFDPAAFLPCYGLAESTLMVSGKPHAVPPHWHGFDPAALTEHRVRRDDSSGARVMVSCGPPTSTLRIVDPTSLQGCPDEQIGEVWVQGEHVAQGYWGQPEATTATFQAFTSDTHEGPFLRTGDLGFLHDGELYITGRIKDLIIIRGRNHAPHDLEYTMAASHPSLRHDGGAAFTVSVDGTERLVLMQELDYRQNPDPLEVVGAIRAALAEMHELAPAAILLMRPATLPKTSSGKIQRYACRELFVANSLTPVFHWSDQRDGQRDLETPTLDIHALVATVLGCSAETLDSTQPIMRYGLDSLTAIDLAHTLERRYGVAISAAHLLNGMTVDEITAAVELGPSAEPSPHDDASEFPLSAGQQALWMLWQLAPTSAAYTIARAIRIRSAFDVTTFQSACDALVAHHPLLRATFHSADGAVVQRIAPSGSANVTIHQGAWTTAELESRAWQPFDLEHGPLLRIDVYVSADECAVLIAMHHIIGDLWSLIVLLQQLIQSYEALQSRIPLVLEPLQGTYAGYVRHQHEQIASAEGARRLAFWREQLHGELSVLNVPTDRPRPAMQSYAGDSMPFALDAALVDQLRSLARTHNTTMFMVLLAAFQVLLHRHSNQEEIIVGSPLTGREQAWMADIVGYFVTILPHRSRFTSHEPFTDVLARMRTDVLAAMEHAYPFPLLVEALQPERDASHAPIVQALFTFQQPHSGVDIGGLALGDLPAQLRFGPFSADVIPLRQAFAQVDLALMMVESEGRLLGSMQYATALFNPDTIKVVISHFQTLLAEIVAAPTWPITALPLAPADEITRSGTRSQSAYERTATIPQAFARQAAATPDAIALRWDNHSLSYRELDQRSTNLAHMIRAEGLGAEMVVGVCLERSPELIVALLAILKAGGTYVPLDPNYPSARLAMMLDDCAMTLLISTRQLASRLPTGHTRLLYVEDDLRHSNESDGDLLQGNPDQLAYVMYTSGSTGRPKGVAVTHRAVIRLVRHTNYARLDSSTRLLQYAPIAFDAATFEIWGALLNGGCLVLAPVEPLTPQAFGDLLEREQITTLWLTAGLFHSIIDEHPAAFANVRQLLAGGDVVSGSHVRRALEHMRDGVIINGYGPTENTTFTCCHTIRPSDLERPSIPIGTPINHTDVVILDRWLRPTPIGVAGELYAGGDGLARGYLGRPDLTATRFVPHPFGDQPGERLYRTGDYARYLPDGTIEFLGRGDHQIKLRGFRIELEEINAVLCQSNAIKTAGVIVREDRPGDKRIVAYLVPSGESIPTPTELHDYLSEHLPRYMIPSAFVPLPALPLDVNGKLNRQALPAPNREHFATHGPAVAPQTETERTIAAIWAEVLGCSTVGLHDHFFSLGGHSLLATQVITRLRETFHVDIPLSTLFQTPTVAGLASAIERQQADARLSITPVTNDAAQLLERIDDLSEADIDQLLQAYLSNPQQEAQ